MSDKIRYRLTGGILFMLMLQALKQRTKAREHYRGERDGLSDLEVLKGLLKVINPSYNENNSLSNSTVNKYKSCIIDAATYLPLDDNATVNAFDIRVKSDYVRALKNMNQFVDSFIDIKTEDKKDELLIRAIIDLMGKDDSIPNDQVFYICMDSTTKTKEEILLGGCFEFQAFLLGVLHYCVMKHASNKEGKETYDLLCPPTGGGPRKYVGTLGCETQQVLRITYFDDSIYHEAPEEPDTVVLEENDTHSEKKDAPVQNVNNPFTFIQNGGSGTQIGYVQNLVIGQGDK